MEPRPATTLGRIQADLLDLIDRGAPGAAEAVPLPDLESLQIHACPGPQREVEVLHDQLLYLFTALPDLRPSEVRIMTPDIERYAPHIEAIFDNTWKAAGWPKCITSIATHLQMRFRNIVASASPWCSALRVLSTR